MLTLFLLFSDPIFLVDEEDIREGPMVKQGPGIIMERVQEALNKEEGEEEGVDYRQLSETGGFTRVVRKRGRGKGIEGVDGPSSAPWGDSNTDFIMVSERADIYNRVIIALRSGR